MIRRLRLSGNAYSIGKQHGEQVTELRPHIYVAIADRLAKLEVTGIDVRAHEQELLEVWQVQAPSILNMLRGLADSLSLEWERFFRYTVSTFLMDQAKKKHHEAQGCTTWAAGAPVTKDGEPMLVKNRDYWQDHQHLQCLASTYPETGYPYLNLTSAGSPGVFSSGMNAAGLAVADTHVVSMDIGPGVPRYHLMMEILEQHDSVASALDYLRTVRFMGNGTLILQDSRGESAVVECGYSSSPVIMASGGFSVSTNHYTTKHLEDSWLPSSQREHLAGNSEARYQRVQQALQQSGGQVDLDWAKSLMRSHTGPLDTLCRHLDLEPNIATIACAIYLPQRKELHLANGRPCREEFTVYRID